MVIESIQKNLEAILGQIEQSAKRAGRDPRDITLVAVSKRQPIEKVQALLDLAPKYEQKIVLGENFVQEWDEKAKQIRGSLPVHFIGHLQSNKAKKASELFSCIQTVDSEKLVRKIESHCLELGKSCELFLQVNVSGDEAKSGLRPEELPSFIEKITPELSAAKLSGLMTITAFYEEHELVRPDFRAMRKLRDDVLQMGSLQSLSLSMGMSSDFQIAIEEGADLVRVGTALFGVRT